MRPGARRSGSYRRCNPGLTMEMTLQLEHWKLKQPFTTSKFSISNNTALTVELRDGDYAGRGECEPHEYDAVIAEEVLNSIEEQRPLIEKGLGAKELGRLFPPGPARNALDCALWDLAAKRSGRRAWELAGVALNHPLTTAYTISLGSADEMSRQARENRDRPLLKLKLGQQEILSLVESVRRAAPRARLLVDVNGAWNIDDLNRYAGSLERLGVELIEQPLPVREDADLSAYSGRVPLCADESCLDTGSLSALNRKYSCVNIKLDKTGGLTEALRLARAARRGVLRVMVGCMNGTSLAIAPAMVVGALADLCDLDGPLLLKHDRIPGLVYEGSRIGVPTPALWG